MSIYDPLHYHNPGALSAVRRFCPRGIEKESDDAGAHLPWILFYLKHREDCGAIICFYNKLMMRGPIFAVLPKVRAAITGGEEGRGTRTAASL